LTGSLVAEEPFEQVLSQGRIRVQENRPRGEDNVDGVYVLQ
jgi:hypothetical protein